MSVERRRFTRSRQAQDTRAPGASFAASDSKEMLLAKYQELCVEYHDLVTRYEAAVADRSGAVSLALTAMRTSTTGLALFHEDRVLAQNVAFDELTSVMGSWRRQGGPRRPLAQT